MNRMEQMKREDWKIASHGAAGFCVKTRDGEHVFEDLKSMLLWQLEDQPQQRDLVQAAFARVPAR